MCISFPRLTPKAPAASQAMEAQGGRRGGWRARPKRKVSNPSLEPSYDTKWKLLPTPRSNSGVEDFKPGVSPSQCASIFQGSLQRHLLLPKQWRPRKPRKKEVPNKSDPERLRDHRFRILRPNRRKILCGSASTAWLGRPWQAEVTSTKNALQWQSGRQLPGGPGRSKGHKFPVQGHRYSSKHFACVS